MDHGFIWEALPTWGWVVSLILIVLVLATLYYTFIMVIKRKIPYIILSVCTAAIIATFLLNLMYVFVLAVAVLVVFTLFVVYTNVGDFRQFFGNPFQKVSSKGVRGGVERLFDRDEVYAQIDAAVKSLSNSKTGAIITFERNTTLKDIIKNGVPINAPVSSELLLTIFYPGTRLHDGAVVIHNDEIIAASVFYTPSTRPFAVKYGSRHRAAIGISEISDAVTVVVSEETGRISIATNGQLDLVSSENFLNVFTNYMTTEVEGN